MPGAEVVLITGLGEAKKYFRDLPASIMMECFPDALLAGAEVIESEIGRRTPMADRETTSARKYGRLVDDLSTTVAIEPQRLTGNAKIGFGDDGFPARMVEFGHAQVAHGAAGVEVGHVPAHPFMRPAADIAESGAIEAFSDSISSHLANLSK